MPITVDGSSQLVGSMKAAGQELADMKPAHARVAALVADAARVPRRSGALAASLRPSTDTGRAIVSAGAGRVRYAGVIHWGWPRRNIRPQTFLADAAKSTEPAWLAAYTESVQTVLDTVRGA